MTIRVVVTTVLAGSTVYLVETGSTLMAIWNAVATVGAFYVFKPAKR